MSGGALNRSGGEGNELKFLLIVFVVMVALSPLLSMMPSRQQRRLAGLREQAAALGLSIQLLDLPTLAGSEPLQPFYRRQRREQEPRGEDRQMFLRRESRWVLNSRTVSAAQNVRLAQFPASVRGLMIDTDGAGVFWDESGDLQELEAIYDLLARWQADGGGSLAG